MRRSTCGASYLLDEEQAEKVGSRIIAGPHSRAHVPLPSFTTSPPGPRFHKKTMTLSTTSCSLLAVLILGALAPVALEAQRRTSTAAPTGGWAPMSIGAHVGYDNNSQATILGAQIHAPIVRSGMIEFMPSGNVTFLTGLKEYQLNLDAVWVSGGRNGGLYAGGGVAARNTVYEIGSERETRVGGSGVVGLRSGSGSIAGIQLEARKTWLDADFSPTAFTIGINISLWGG